MHTETWLVNWLKGALLKELLCPSTKDGWAQVFCAVWAGLLKALGNTRDAL